MKILVYPHDLGIGGSQLNAIEIGHEVSLLGHEVIVYGAPGPLTSRIAQLGLEFVESPDPGRRPTPEVVRDLAGLIDTRGIDIAHGYEWPPGLECYLACKGHRKARAVTTVMSMAVAPFLPHSMPVVVGTEQIAEVERAGGRHLVSVIEPPVDIEANRPGAAPGLGAFREQWDLDDRPTIVCVTRLARQLKLEGLLTAIDAVEALHLDVAARLVIVGDGEARPEVEERANQVNRTLGYHAVVLTGEMSDPRPAYDLADVCIGMGGSALRSMAFAKPLIVQGEGGFFRLLTPETLPTFMWTGWYGHGTEAADPVRNLQHLLFELLGDRQRSRQLGQFGRTTIEDRFSLDSAAKRQIEIYESVLRRHPRAQGTVLSDIASTARFARYHADKRKKRILGLRASDDFNAAPVARNGPVRPAQTRANARLVSHKATRSRTDQDF